jgi:hypothetical protein
MSDSPSFKEMDEDEKKLLDLRMRLDLLKNQYGNLSLPSYEDYDYEPLLELYKITVEKIKERNQKREFELAKAMYQMLFRDFDKVAKKLELSPTEKEQNELATDYIRKKLGFSGTEFDVIMKPLLNYISEKFCKDKLMSEIENTEEISFTMCTIVKFVIMRIMTQYSHEVIIKLPEFDNDIIRDYLEYEERESDSSIIKDDANLRRQLSSCTIL